MLARLDGDDIAAIHSATDERYGRRMAMKVSSPARLT